MARTGGVISFSSRINHAKMIIFCCDSINNITVYSLITKHKICSKSAYVDTASGDYLRFKRFVEVNAIYFDIFWIKKKYYSKVVPSVVVNKIQKRKSNFFWIFVFVFRTVSIVVDDVNEFSCSVSFLNFSIVLESILQNSNLQSHLHFKFFGIILDWEKWSKTRLCWLGGSL